MALAGGSSGFSMPNLPKVQRALAISPTEASRGLWSGTRRSLGGFRKDWLTAVPVNIKGRGRKAPGGRKPGKTVGGSFLWLVKPNKRGAVTRPEQIYGKIYSDSFAAHGLEVGGTAKGEGGHDLAIPITGSGAGHRETNTSASGRVKKSWKTVGLALKQRRFQFSVVDRGEHSIIRARRRLTKKQQKSAMGKKGAKIPREWVPIFILRRDVKLTPGRLRFFSFWAGTHDATLKRYEKEIDKAMAKWWKR